MSHREPHPMRVLCLLVATYWGVDEEGGGYSELVSVHASSEQPAVVRNAVLQFHDYDYHSLNVLMSEGMVPCLVTILQKPSFRSQF